MKYTACLFICCILACLTAHAQRGRDTLFYRQTPIPAKLQPIERAVGSSILGSVYFYGGKKLSSPYSLEVPFYELNDPTVNHHFQAFRTMTTLSRLTGLATLGYALLNRNGTSGSYWTVYGGSVAAALTFTLIGNGQVNKAVTRYNDLLRQTRFSLSAAPLTTGGTALGAGLAVTF